MIINDHLTMRHKQLKIIESNVVDGETISKQDT